MTSEIDTVEIEGRHIFFSGKIEQKNIIKLIKIINKLNDDAKKEVKELEKKITSEKYKIKVEPLPVFLHITSYGGSLLASFGAIDHIINSFVPIYTIVEGYVASAASLLVIVGKKRYMSENSFLMIHQLNSSNIGPMNKIIDDFTNCMSFMKRLVELYKKYTKMTEDEINNQLKHDEWWNCDIAIEKGLVDDKYTDKII
jgi:ATP-dependent protease ClpP protease subunit